MTVPVIGIYDFAIVMGAFASFALLLGSAYFLKIQEGDETEYVFYYLFTLFISWVSTVGGIGLAYTISDVNAGFITTSILFTIYILFSVIICIVVLTVILQDIRKGIFIGTFGSFIIGLTVSIVFIFGPSSTPLILDSPDIIGLNGGVGFIILSIAIGLSGFIMSTQIEPYVSEISDFLAE